MQDQVEIYFEIWFANKEKEEIWVREILVYFPPLSFLRPIHIPLCELA